MRGRQLYRGEYYIPGIGDVSDVESKCFEIVLPVNYFYKGDIISLEDGLSYEVVSVPRSLNKWYQRLLRWLSCGKLFKDIHTYKVRLKK